MITAQEARNKAATFQTRQSDAYRVRLMEAIEDAVDRGEYYITVYNNVLFTDEMANMFRELGYEVTMPEIKYFVSKDGTKSEQPFYTIGHISWRDNGSKAETSPAT